MVSGESLDDSFWESGWMIRWTWGLGCWVFLSFSFILGCSKPWPKKVVEKGSQERVVDTSSEESIEPIPELADTSSERVVESFDAGELPPETAPKEFLFREDDEMVQEDDEMVQEDDEMVVPEVIAEATPETSPGTKAIQAPWEKWTWVDFPESRCGYGKPTGIVVNPMKKSDTLLLYLQGGGGCWKDRDILGGCFSIRPSANHLKGFVKKDFDRSLFPKSLIFDRKNTANPFSKMHFVFVPYCTGDVHTGNTKKKFGAGRTMYFYGRKNLEAYLARVIPTFPNIKRVILAGSSAGGFGTAFNWEWVQTQFGSQVRVDVLDDSGPPLQAAKNLWKNWTKTWKIQFPSSCKDCAEGATNMLNHYRKTMFAKGNKFGFLTYDRDFVIRVFFNLGGGFGRQYSREIGKLFVELDKEKGAHYFGLRGDSHVLLVPRPEKLVSSDKMPLLKWLEQFVTDDPKWKSHRP